MADEDDNTYHNLENLIEKYDELINTDSTNPYEEILELKELNERFNNYRIADVQYDDNSKKILQQENKNE